METDQATSYDADALRDKYREERDKRLRAEGNDQYVEITGPFAHYLEDPYTEWTEREPLTDEVEVVVIGAGFGGLLTGARLRERGVDSVRIIEKAGDVGGTWYWNRYPGAMCDTEAYIYLPLLEETGYVPTEKYVHAPEILEHSRRIARHYDLYRDAVFQTEVTDFRWDEDAARWIIETNRGDSMRAQFVCMASGPLHRPKLPGIPGLTDYEGHSFHTSRWDYDYTGGDEHGGLTGLAGKRVAVIGTGATAVQVVPAVAQHADQLFLFQRTPSSIDVRDNRPTDPDWASSLEPGWQRRRMWNFTNLTSGVPDHEDLVADGWTDIIGRFIDTMRKQASDGLDVGQLAELMETVDFEKMEQIRARVESIVEDPDVAESLKPYYRQFCKRPCFHDEYLPAFNRPNVTLVDTDGRGVDRLTPRGIVVGEVEYEVDCIVYATGFEVGTSYARRSGCEVHGRGGRTLTEHWADGARTMHGFHVRNFPNLFIISLIQSAMTANFPHMLDEQSRHLAHLIGHCLDEGIETVEVSDAAEQEWVDTIVSMTRMNERFQQECTPGYYNNEGQLADATARQGAVYGAGPVPFIRVLETWRDAGDFAGLEFDSTGTKAETT